MNAMEECHLTIETKINGTGFSFSSLSVFFFMQSSLSIAISPVNPPFDYSPKCGWIYYFHHFVKSDLTYRSTNLTIPPLRQIHGVEKEQWQPQRNEDRSAMNR